MIRAHARRDEAARSEQLGRHGWEHVLARLHSSISWAAPVLDYTTSPAHHAAPCGPRDLYLDGRGLGLVPSVFARATALWVPPGDATPLLRYPVRPALHLPASITGVRDFALDRLAALLGATRAAVLEKIAEGRLTTTELACALRISASSASEHTTVLRCGGLVRSHRDRNRVYHEITRTGRGLVDAVLAGAA
ncbi:MAG TPA: winged helix-turn-helix domain-containing protein [Pilimelia sp.]|nr:winged helix-turn-helix domain-containing protein [Pilimelia sp.]